MGTFVPDQTLVLAGGKLKDRNNWSEADEDNNILPCPLKLFDILTGEVVCQLKGHTEELLCVKRVQFKGENYFLSGSQDGYLNKWHMDSDWRYVDFAWIERTIACQYENEMTRSWIASLIDMFACSDRSLKVMEQMEDGITCMAFTVSFVPNTGNKYFLAAADENLRLYDFEHATVRFKFHLVSICVLLHLLSGSTSCQLTFYIFFAIIVVANV